MAPSLGLWREKAQRILRRLPGKQEAKRTQCSQTHPKMLALPLQNQFQTVITHEPSAGQGKKGLIWV